MADKNSGKSLITGKKSTLSKKKLEEEKKKKKKEAEKARKALKKREKDMWEEMESAPDSSSQTSYTRRGGPKVGAEEMFREMNN
jgi:hypothetical protein